MRLTAAMPTPRARRSSGLSLEKRRTKPSKARALLTKVLARLPLCGHCRHRRAPRGEGDAAAGQRLTIASPLSRASSSGSRRRAISRLAACGPGWAIQLQASVTNNGSVGAALWAMLRYFTIISATCCSRLHVQRDRARLRPAGRAAEARRDDADDSAGRRGPHADAARPGRAQRRRRACRRAAARG